jgi:uncharacterized protein YjaZ
LESFAAVRGLAPILNLDPLETAIAQLEVSDVDELVRKAFARADAALSGPPTTVWLLAGDSDDSFTTGMAGGVNATVAGVGKIWLHLVPIDGWTDRLPAAIAHEHHHSVWLSQHYRGQASETLLNYLVMEGQACVFAELLCPSAPQPWAHALTREQEQEVWRRMEPNLRSSSHEVMAAYMFGDVEGLPPLCGYTIGYMIVQACLRRCPDMGIEDWTAMDGDAMLAQSRYGSLLDGI